MLSLVHLIYMAGDKCMRQNACNNSYNCLTCPKKFKRQEDLGKHAKVCLKEKLEAEEPKNQPSAI